jgi:hypothetical protein
MREGGSLPGLMEADDDGLYVVKFRGAGQGPNVLVAEVLCAQLAGTLGLPVPRWAPVEVPAALAPAEPDEEVQELLRASAGLNLGIDFLPGAIDAGPAPPLDPELAGRILWFDAFVGNVDRSWRNPNLLLWHRMPYLIDHGACLVFHHSWAPGPDGRPDPAQVARFAAGAYQAADHAVAECRPDVAAADRSFAGIDWDHAIDAAVSAVPEGWLDPGFAGPAQVRAAYRTMLLARLQARPSWLPQLVAAAAAGPVRDAAGRRISARGSAGPPDWIPELRIGRGS